LSRIFIINFQIPALLLTKAEAALIHKTTAMDCRTVYRVFPLAKTLYFTTDETVIRLRMILARSAHDSILLLLLRGRLIRRLHPVHGRLKLLGVANAIRENPADIEAGSTTEIAVILR
jgi:hypothetical protein